ncbi:MAG TPA: monovalent cation/H(+) antiporter subunit G [Pseudohongiella sp.]|nr:monovalent cation/H(+) antiporter subunit G [Pseudohongiella sp.]
MLTHYLSWGLLVLGGFLCVSGAIGLLRFPDFFTRMHAASVTDTLAAGMIMCGLMLQAPSWIVFAKLVMILVFILLTAPTSGHALAKAALHSGMKPLLPDSKHAQGGL